ncbi:MAG TPA: hypothetical protein VHA52_12975, partial [Candidatus Babeliaceae bacterium]|nr:hypothetical protein [Candidatus Babeliaceae bacterium]
SETYQPLNIIIKTDGFFSSLFYKDDFLGIRPIQPLKVKRANGETGVDIAFYTNILLNLVEDFGLYELRTNF